MRNLLDIGEYCAELGRRAPDGESACPQPEDNLCSIRPQGQRPTCDALVVENRRLLFDGAVAEPPPGISFHVRGFIPSTRSTPKDARSKLGNKFKGEK